MTSKADAEPKTGLAFSRIPDHGKASNGIPRNGKGGWFLPQPPSHNDQLALPFQHRFYSVGHTLHHLSIGELVDHQANECRDGDDHDHLDRFDTSLISVQRANSRLDS